MTSTLSPLEPVPAGSSGSSRRGYRIGIDIGGTGIKYGIVDTADGTVVGPVLHVPTPRPATPEAIADALAPLVAELSAGETGPPSDAPVGVALPAIVQHGTARSAANIDESWIGLDTDRFLTERLGRRTTVLNDADAAGLAEFRFGAGHGVPGVVLVLTLGTGIGSALIVDGRLVPNLELGHLEIGGVKAETRASAVARERDGLDWTEYAGRLQQYLAHVEFLFSPDLIIIGGGISARSADFLPHLDLRATVIPAELQNAAGVVGAALQGLEVSA